MDSLFRDMVVWRCVFPLRFAFKHNLASRNEVETLVLCVRTADGSEGFGQALPRSYLTGETIATALHSIRDQWWPRLASLPFSGAKTFEDGINLCAPVYDEADACRNNAAYSAVETAVLDAFAHSIGVPAILPPATNASIPLVGVISATGERKVSWMVRVLRVLGYRHFKIKVGNDPDADTQRIAMVRRYAGPDAWLAVDANQAWTYQEALSRMEKMRQQNIMLVEEPLHHSETDRLGELECSSGIPVMVDETLCTKADAAALLDRGSPSWWNLRLGKCGGFSALCQLGAMAAEASINVYGGVLVGETSALAAAGRAAMFGAGARIAEYGFPRIFLKGDPFRGGPGGWTGKARPPAPTAGLGISVMQKALEKGGEIVWQSGG